MRLGLVGLGRMGAQMAARLVRDGHLVVGYDPSPAARVAAEAHGVKAAASPADLVEALPAPRAVWLMVPAGEPTEAAIRELAPRLAAGDVVVDGGNTHYRDDGRRAAELGRRGIDYLDVGVSGG